MKYPDAGINPAKSGLTARAGLYFKAGLHDKGDGFNLQDLDPYLLFDAETSMLGNLENPTLDLDPATPDTLDVITATRAGTATFTAADGQIVTADPNTVRVDHVQGEELTPTKFQRVGYTDFSSGWNIGGGGTLLETGTANGETYVQVEHSSGSYMSYLTVIVNPSTTIRHTASFYARLVSGSSQNLYLGNINTDKLYTSITLTEEWQRFTVDVLPASSVNFGIYSYASGVVFEISKPQFEEGTTATDFVPNTSGSPLWIASATYGPRVPMMLIEPSATNLLTQTDFSAGWSLSSGATIEQTTEATPLPPQTALRLQSNGVSSRYQAPSGYPSGTSTASVYIKWDGVDTRFRIARGISSSSSTFDVTEGSVTLVASSADAYSIEYHGDGWWRVSNTATNPTWIQLFADDLNGTGSILVALPQHEAGTLATSFIPTSGSAVTRNGDQLSIIGSNFTNFFNGSEGTFFVTVRNKAVQDSYGLLYSHGTARFVYSNSGTPSVYSYDGSNVIPFGSPNENVDTNFAISYNSSASEKKGARDGNQEETRSYTGSFSTATDLRIGWGNGTLNGHIRRILYWPTYSDSL